MFVLFCFDLLAAVGALVVFLARGSLLVLTFVAVVLTAAAEQGVLPRTRFVCTAAFLASPFPRSPKIYPCSGSIY